MDHRSFGERKSLRGEDNSLGILNMDKLKGKGKFFGEISYDSFKNRNSNGGSGSRASISDRLNNEKIKALETLQKADAFKRPFLANNKENSKSSINVSSSNPSMQLDNTDYVPFRRPNAINISDLVTDETINLESISSSPTSASKDSVKVSFEPSEITGRSTLYNRDMMKQHKTNATDGNTNRMSVSDILASSFAPKARNLCETLHGDATTLSSKEPHAAALPSSNTSFSSFNGTHSLPRTADMSFSKISCTEESFNRGIASFGTAGAGTSLDESEMFAPGELMQSMLINDEISWAQERATIPSATLSAQAKAKILLNSAPISNGFETPSTSNSMIADDPNFSVGNFFNMRSDNVSNIVKTKSPDKFRAPVALVDEEDNTVTTTSDIEGSLKISITPKIDNKTYTRVESPLATQLKRGQSLSRPSQHLNHESKDSGNSTDNSYLLSISAIDRALCNLDMQSNTSAMAVSEQLLRQAKKAKSCLNLSKGSSNNQVHRSSLGYPDLHNNSANTDKMAAEQMILENKENLDPCRSKRSPRVSTLSDTMSFSESLLDSSDAKLMQRSLTQQRSPLSPIDIRTPAIRISDDADDAGVEADQDDWPGTPIINNRRIRRTKSPRDKSPFTNNVEKNDFQSATTPLNTRPSRAFALNRKNISENEPKSLSSTRLDGAINNANVDNNFEISPNLSNGNHYVSSLVVRRNTVNAAQINSPIIASPNRLDNSPMSSPRSYRLSQAASPTATTIDFPSPNLDATSSSDRQLLNVGAARKVVSSPVGSEASSTCSYGTYRSAMSAAGGRSVSRCSTTSEFSHRDGKQIPLKITNMELSWGSIKLRSDSRKSMQIKNITNKRLVIRIEVSGPGFQIINSQRGSTITMHSQECRSISISFCPTVAGVAIGKLSFYAPSGATAISNSFLDVPLIGYGGNASIIAQNIFTGPVGSPFVTMGDICELAQPLERTISFYNKGPLLGFASVTVDSIGLMIPRLSDAFDIHPRRILIPPKCMVDIHIVFRPKREEIRKIIKKMGSVLTLANLRVICGDEVNRQRIRRLLIQMTEEERSKLSSSSLDLLWSDFPQEIEMSDLMDIKENTNAALDLLSFFRIHEILLTINHDNSDDTFEASSIFLADVDETVLFRTVCAAADSPTPSSNLGTVAEDDEYNQELVLKVTKPNSWSVSPPTVDIDLRKPQPVTLRINNGFKSRQFFEIACNSKELLNITPSDGYLLPDGGEANINICLQANFKCPTENVFIMVNMENERIMVPVNIIK